jgi:mono/diheme cytochrome c family protein
MLAAGCGEAAPSDPDLAAGRTVYRTCAACHGKSGEGGAGPALAGVMATFPDCEEQIRWISLGSQRWREEVGDTYGATAKPVAGAMASFAESLSETEIRQVALYERVRFGEADVDAERSACGLA